MSAFPMQCNLVHARQMRRSMSQQNYANQNAHAKVDGHEHTVQNQHVQRQQSSPPEHQHNCEQAKNVTANENIKNHIIGIKGINIAKFAKFRLAEPNTLMFRSISLQNVLMQRESGIPATEMDNMVCKSTAAKKMSSIGAINAKTSPALSPFASSDNDDTTRSTSIGVNLSRAILLAASKTALTYRE